MNLVVLGVALIATVVAGFRFYRWELATRTVDVVIVLLTVLVLDVVLYPESETATQTSVFNISVGEQSVRLLQLLLVAAVLARLLARGIPRRFSLAAPFWLAFFVWVAVSAAIGWLAGNSTNLIVRHSLVVVMVGGSLLVAGGANVLDYVTSIRLQRFMVLAAITAAVLFITDTFDVTLATTNIPGLPVTELGTYGADAATVFTCLGVIAIGLGLGREPAKSEFDWSRVVGSTRPGASRGVLLVSGAVMFASLLASPQRAARLAAAVVVGVLVIAVAARKGRARLRLTSRALLLSGLAACATACFVLVVTSVAIALRTPENSVASHWTTESIGATTRIGSVESRFNQWTEAWKAVESSPVVGQGLGNTEVHFEEGENAFVESDINHNIALDVLTRTGVIGLSLAAIAVIITVIQGVSVWRSATANAVAFWALSAVAIVAGLLAKGMVESILEKDRLASLLGLALGFVGAAVTRGYDLSDLEPGVRIDGQGTRAAVSSSSQKPSWPPMLRNGPSPHKRGRHSRD